MDCPISVYTIIYSFHHLIHVRDGDSIHYSADHIKGVAFNNADLSPNQYAVSPKSNSLCKWKLRSTLLPSCSFPADCWQLVLLSWIKWLSPRRLLSVFTKGS
jgi:hypothetical protein